MTFRPNRLQLFAMIMANNLGQMGFLLLPLWLDAAMVTHEISERGAGWLASIQLAAVALASLAVSSRVDRLPWTRFALVGVLCVTGGDLLAAFASDLSILYLSRAVCGLGSGILISLATAIAARSERPQQTYSIFAFSVAVFTLVGMLAAPLLIERFGAAGVFAGMSMLSLAFTGLLLFLPGHPEGETKTEAAEQPSGFIILAALTATGIYQLALTAIWTWSARIGQGTGMSLQEVGFVLWLGSVVMLAGPAVAKVLGMRFGRLLPIAFVKLIMIAASFLVAYATVPWMYWTASLLMPLMVLFGQPYYMATYAALDSRGRVAAAAPVFTSIGSAVGPIAAGVVISSGGYPGIGWLALACYVFTLMLVLPAAYRPIPEKKTDVVRDTQNQREPRGDRIIV